MRSWRALVAVVGVGVAQAGCIEDSLVDCGNGIACPAGLVCRALTAPDEQTCVTQQQLDACADLGERDACSVGAIGNGNCHDGVCLPIVCGNSRVDKGESCDDGNTTTGDGTCSADCLSDETCGNSVVDPLRVVIDENGDPKSVPNEQCDDGNLVSNDGCSSRCNTEALVWQLGNESIGSLTGAAMAYDALRRRIVLFGGAYLTAGGKVAHSDATFEFDGARWTKIITAISPSGREDHQMAYDAVHHTIVLFGGRAGDDNTPVGDTWEWNGTTWTRRAPSMSPHGRSRFGMVYDSAGKRVVLFGGFTGTAVVNDTWTWDGTTWTQLVTPTSPQNRDDFAMGYDPTRGAVIVTGGADEGTPPWRDTWELVGTTWTQTSTSAPSELDRSATIAFDPTSQRMIAFGGQGASQNQADGKTFAFSGGTWTELSPAGASPAARFEHAVATDPVSGSIVIFGGFDLDPDTFAPILFDDTWRWSNDAWTQVPAAFVPPVRQYAVAAYDPLHGRVWQFGGEDAPDTYSSALSSFDGTSWHDHGTGGPTGREFHSLAYDTARARLVLFGGWDSSKTLMTETWLWDGTSWTNAQPATSPPPRLAPGLAYDRIRKVTVMFGGVSDNTLSTFIGDTWEWDGTTWKQIVAPQNPGPRIVDAMFFDVTRKQLVLFGGYDGVSGMSDMWTFDGTTWTQLAASTPLAPRVFSPIAYDAAARHAVLFGGQTFGGSTLSDTWTWSGGSWHEQSAVIHPTDRGRQLMFQSPDGAGVVLFGGTFADSNIPSADMQWLLRYQNDEPRELCTGNVDHDGDGLAGCADEDCWASCTPLCPPGTIPPGEATCDPAAPRCGDGMCNASIETCRNCPGDCACTAVCGDTFCDAGETHAACAGDCP